VNIAIWRKPLKTLSTILKHVLILFSRFREQGIRVTLTWIYARLIPLISGVPTMKFNQLTDQIYVGPQFRQKGKKRLRRNGINSVVNMRIEYDDAKHGLALDHYCYLPTIDDDAPSIEHLLQGVEFIQERVSAGDKVYIHCGGGIGRAPSMAAAYFISQGYTLEEALAHIRKVRPFIRPTPIQLEQLALFAEQFKK
jgi:protein-tyrosine phosphatase